MIEFTDKDDKMFLEVTISDKADYLITGNGVDSPREEFIVTPKKFIERYSEQITSP